MEDASSAWIDDVNQVAPLHEGTHPEEFEDDQIELNAHVRLYAQNHRPDPHFAASGVLAILLELGRG